jgi:hypothetical protein
MVKIKRYITYFVLVVSMMFLLTGCEKQNGPFGFDTDLRIIKYFQISINSDTCEWNDFSMIPYVEGPIILEDGNTYIYEYISDAYFVKKINVFSVNNYNKKYVSGDNISEIVEIYIISLICNSKNTSGIDPIQIIGTANSINKTIFYSNSKFRFRLKEPPTQNGEYAFIVEIDNGAGELLRDTTKTVYLLKD